ncbi:MAG TPA: tetratricopeptide repeat protein [Bacteroidales bacterium]|nr:tetratricopeptide repeat protein [Bacteroidales bacterium]
MQAIRIRQISFIIGLIIIAKSGFSQTDIPDSFNSYIDSLTELSLNSPNPEVRVDALNKISTEYAHRNPVRIYKYAIDAIELANEINYTTGLIKAYYHLGDYYYFQANFEEAQKYFWKSYSIANQHNIDSLAVDALNVIAVINASMGNYDKAIGYFEKIIRISQEKQFSSSENHAMINIGNCYREQGKNELAEKYYIRAYQQAKIRQANDEQIYSSHNLAVFYGMTGNYPKAIMYCNEAIALAEKIQMNEQILEGQNILANIYIYQNQPGKAIEIAEKALTRADSTHANLQKMHLYNKLMTANEQIGDYESALKWMKLEQTIKDSIFNIEKHFQITNLMEQYESNLKDLEIEKKNNELGRKNSLIRFILIILLIVALSATTIIIMFIRKRKTNKILVKINHELSQKYQNYNIEFIPAISASELTSNGKSNFEENKNENNVKYVSSSLSDERKRELLNRLNKLMSEDALYLDPEISIERVSESLQVNSKYLSQVINEGLGRNFPQYINELRVLESIRILSDPKQDKYSIEAVANMSGFKSKSVFNTAFKKQTGITPSFFRAESKNISIN